MIFDFFLFFVYIFQISLFIIINYVGKYKQIKLNKKLNISEYLFKLNKFLSVLIKPIFKSISTSKSSNLKFFFALFTAF